MSVADYKNATCPDCDGKLKSITFTRVFSKRGKGWTPIMTGPDRQQTRAEVMHDVVQEANRQELLVRRDLENERKEFFDYSPDPIE